MIHVLIRDVKDIYLSFVTLKFDAFIRPLSCWIADIPGCLLDPGSVRHDLHTQRTHKVTLPEEDQKVICAKVPFIL